MTNPNDYCIVPRELTDEMKAQGWRPIGEIVNFIAGTNIERMKWYDGIGFKPYGIIQVEQDSLTFIKECPCDYENSPIVFRVLAPVMPNTITISVDDARYIRDLIYQYDIELTIGEEAILDQLEPDISKLRNVIGKAMNEVFLHKD